MATGTRHRMTGAQRREQLLDVAKAMIDRDGVAAVSIESVARAAGITRPIVYDHFAGLDDLLARMLERETARALGQLTAELPASDGTPREALQAAFRAYLDAVAADPVTWRLVLLAPEGVPGTLREAVRAGREAIVATLAATVGAGFAPDRPSPDPALTARSLSALADEAARLLLTDPVAYPVERLLAHGEWLLDQVAGRP